MYNLKDLMEIKLKGEDIYPENIKAKELADIIINLEESLLNIVKKQHPDISIDEIIIPLVNIDSGSATLRFKPSVPIILSAFIMLSSSIANANFENLPTRSIEGIQVISDFTRKRNCVAEFRVHADSEYPEAIIEPSTDIIVPESFYLIGETVLYGEIERVGGVAPKAVIRIADGRTIHCNVTIELAKELGRRLYSKCGFSGKAKWSAENYLVESFQIEKIIDYQETSILSAITEISSKFGKYYKDIEDVIEYVSKIRGERE